MFEVVIMNNQKVGIEAVEIVENIYTFHHEVDAEVFAYKAREAGFSPRIRRFEARPVYRSDFDQVIANLVKRSV